MLYELLARPSRRHHAAGAVRVLAQSLTGTPDQRPGCCLNRRGTFSQAELTADRVITRCITLAGSGVTSTSSEPPRPLRSIRRPPRWPARVMRGWARSQGVTHVVSVRRYEDGARAESAYPEVIGLAGAQMLAAYQPPKRKVRRRAKRLPVVGGGSR
jgi:hypothetical protein